MIRILIVEDNSHKRENIKTAILDAGNIKEDSVLIAGSVKEAKKFIYDQYFDLMILDLVLPIESGEDADAKNGVGFLETIHSSPMIKPPIHIIGLTSFSDKIADYRDQFNSRLWHLIDYSADSTAWQDRLTTIIYHLVKIRERYITQSIKKHLYDIAIITALPSPELEAVLRLGTWEKFSVEDDVTQYYKATFSNGSKTRTIVAANADQMGMTATSHLATKICLFFKPQYLIMGGLIAGIKDRGLGFGDILIAEQSWDYGSGKITEKEKTSDAEVPDVLFEPDTRDIQLAAELKSKVSSFKLSCSGILDSIQNSWPGDKPSTKLQVHLGPIASGSYVISSEERLKDIRSHQRKLLGVEMETFGLYYAAEHSVEPKTKAISIKSVSDYGSRQKDDSYQKYAAYTSASFIYHFILNEL
jgi:nucleoside phosphorylase